MRTRGAATKAPKAKAAEATHTPAEIAENKVDLRVQVVPKRIPRAEQYRTYFGRSLDLVRIESAIRWAEAGMMIELTDLESEALSLDPTLSALLGKRFGIIRSLGWRMTPASGPGLDKEIAKEIADECRANLKRIRDFRSRLYDLAWGEYWGRAALENEWQFVGGKRPWDLRDLHWVHPRRLSFDRERNLQVIPTNRPFGNFEPQGIQLKDYPSKFVWWTPRLFNEHPEREGLAPRTLYWMFFKRFSWRHRMTLTELFALPWRIVTVDKDANVSPEGLQQAEEAAEQLGMDHTARFEKGISLDLEWPQLGESNSNLFKMNNDDVDKQMSKLVVGNTGTTETEDVNRSGGIIAKGEQDIITDGTGAGVSERMTEQVVLPMVVLNRGAAMAEYCPTFEVITEQPRDRDKDLQLVERVVKLQVPVALEEVREIVGTRAPDEGEAYIVGTGDGGLGAAGQAAGPSVRVVDPSVDGVSDRLPGREEKGVAGEEDAAEAAEDKAADEAIAAALRAVGVGQPAARRAVALCRAGRYGELARVPGLGTEDAAWLVQHVPRRFVFRTTRPSSGAGIRDLCAAAGVKLTDNALAELEGMAPATREAVLEAMLTDDRRRPLDP